MGENYITSAGRPDRLTIDEAADLVVKETEKPRDYVISFLTDCAEQGYFSADVRQPPDHGNVSHISRVDSTKSTVSTAELIEWLNSEIEDAHQRAREAIARRQSQKWGYEIKPEDMHVRLCTWSKRLDDVSSDDTISMTTRDWVEYLAQEIAERQGWDAKEREAKCAIARAEHLNLFVGLANTLPLVQEVTRAPWKGAQLLPDWLTSLHMIRSELRQWAKAYAPEIVQSRTLIERTTAPAADSHKPDWSMWRDVLKASLYEAVCLSCNTTPEAASREISAFLAAELFPQSSASKDVRVEISRRFEIAKRHTGVGGTLSTVTEDKEVHVRLAIFAEWAVKTVKWTVPDELRALMATAQPAEDDESDRSSTLDVESRVAWREAVKKQWIRMLDAHHGKCPPAKKILTWFKANDQEGTFKPGGSDEEFFWVGANGTKTHKTGHKAFSNAIAEMRKRREIPD